MSTTPTTATTQEAGAGVRHFLIDTDLSPEEQAEVLQLAQQIKAEPYRHRPLSGPQTGIVMFDKTSTRTRISLPPGSPNWAVTRW